MLKLKYLPPFLSSVSTLRHLRPHLHHVLLHGLGDFFINGAVVQQSSLKLVVLNLLTTLKVNLVLSLVLLGHHLNHHLHLSLLSRILIHRRHLTLHVLHLLQLH